MQVVVDSVVNIASASYSAGLHIAAVGTAITGGFDSCYSHTFAGTANNSSYFSL